MKIKKLPNGFGSIVYLGASRRSPWAARKSVKGKYKYLGYFKTYEDAFIFLLKYNKKRGLTTFADELTFAEVYKLEMEEHSSKIDADTVNGYRTSFGYCISLHDKPFCQITIFDLQGVIRALSKRGIGQPSQKKVRQLFHNMYKFAIKYGIIRVIDDVSRFVDIDKHKPKYIKKPFNMRQLNRVRKLADDNFHPLSDWAKCIVMMCFAGTRPGEFLAIKKADVKIRSRFFMVRDSKTSAGQNRMVPISKKTVAYFEHWLTTPGKTLIADSEGNPCTYKRFLSYFKKVMQETRCSHKPHECRHTCATWLDDKGANKLSIKRILGHASQDVTDGVYTHKDLRQLKKAIDLL